MADVPDHFFRQSAVVPYRHRKGGLQVLLVTTRKKKRWIVPKGVVDPGLTPAASALKEAWEEAGIRGDVDGPALGRYRYDKWGGICTVEVFPMAVTEEVDEWPEAAERDRCWFTPKGAAKRIEEPKLAALLKTFAPPRKSP